MLQSGLREIGRSTVTATRQDVKWAKGIVEEAYHECKTKDLDIYRPCKCKNDVIAMASGDDNLYFCPPFFTGTWFPGWSPHFGGFVSDKVDVTFQLSRVGARRRYSKCVTCVSQGR